MAPSKPDDPQSSPGARIGRRHQADQLLGKRWTGLIVRVLLTGPCRFSGIAAHIGTLSDRILSTRLGELEAQGVVERRVDGEVKPVRIVYALTPMGYALGPVMREIDRWAEEWVDGCRAGAVEGGRAP